MSIEIAARYLKEGQLVAIPTETVYGLAGNAFDEDAVKKVFLAKNRPFTNPLIVHCASLREVEELVTEIPAAARRLADNFWPGPLTLLLPKSSKISSLVTAGQERVAIRIPDHPLTLELLRTLDFPLVAPSANPFGYVSPTTAEHVRMGLGDQVAYILDGGTCSIGIESTIVGFEQGAAKIFRPGGIPAEQIGILTDIPSSYLGPGMLKSHYAPTRRLILGSIPELLREHHDKRLGILSFRTAYPGYSIVLSPSGSLEEAAHNLFAALRQLDKSNVDLIIAEEVPSYGLGIAINDRLHKAACHKQV